MPRPLHSLPKTDRDIYGALASEPLEGIHAAALADSAEEAMENHRSVLLRSSRLALYELLHGKALTDAECVEAMADPKEQDRRISRAIGTPEAAILPDLRTPEGIRAQYAFQTTLLASLDLLERDKHGNVGITGIDGNFHLLPSLETIGQRLTRPEMHRKMEQGFDQLLLVPFALPLSRLIEAWKEHLLRNEHFLQEHGGLNRNEPVFLWTNYGPHSGRGPDQDGRLVYSPQRFTQNHGGDTKAHCLAADPAAGWDVLLIEGSLLDLLRNGQGTTIGDRQQVEAGRTPREYLASLPAGEAGWTPESYVTAFLTQLERTGHPLDTDSSSYLIASYLPGPGRVPRASRDPGRRQANLVSRHPDLGDPGAGVRGAVRVI